MTERHKSGVISKNGMWRLFLLVSFPINFWALLIALRNIEPVINLTNYWEGIGATSYAMVFAIIESVGLFILFAGLGYLLPKSWLEGQKVMILGMLSFVVTLWGILKQINFELLSPAQKYLAKGAYVVLLERTSRPLVYGAISLSILFIILILSVILPIWGVVRSERFRLFVEMVFERLYILALFYVILDLLAVVIIAVRNI